MIGGRRDGTVHRVAHRSGPRATTLGGTPVCLQCGLPARRPGTTICSRCGLPYGDPPRADSTLATCPICYRTTDDDGRLPSAADPMRRLDLSTHVDEHDRFPVGDDEWLETLRRGDRIRVGRWLAPFDLVRRYLVTGIVDGGRLRATRHDAIITAMTQVARWGPDGSEILGDQPDWREARAAVATLMERYHRRTA